MKFSTKKTALVGLLAAAIVSLFIAVSTIFRPVDAPLPRLEPLDLSGMERQVEQKIKALLETAESSPHSAEAWGRLAMNLDVHGLKQEAVPCYEYAAGLAPQDFRWPYFCAIALNELGSPYALAWFERAQKRNSGYAPMLYRYGMALFEANRAQDAKNAFLAALASDSLYVSVYTGLAQVAISAAEYEKGERYLLQATKISPKRREAHLLLADVYKRMGDFEKANREMDLAASLSPFRTLPDSYYARLIDEGVSSYWYRFRGLIFMQRKEYDKAAGAFMACLKNTPTADAHYNLGLAFKYQKKYAEAVEQFKKSTKRNPAFAVAFANLGEVSQLMGKVKIAQASLSQAVKLSPKLKNAYYQLGMLYMRDRERKAAIKTFREGLQHNPEDARMSFRLAWLLATSPDKILRDNADAVRLAEFVNHQTDGRSPEALDILAAAYADAGEFNKAVVYAETAYRNALREGKNSLATNVLMRKKLFEKRQPYRERW